MKLFRVIFYAFVACFATIYSCSNPPKEQIISHTQVYYDFINILDTNADEKPFFLAKQPLTWNLLDRTIQNCIDEYLPKSDSSYLRQEVIAAKNFKWNRDSIHDKIVIDFDSLYHIGNPTDTNGMQRMMNSERAWDRFHAVHGKKTEIYSYSIPLFSKDQNKCLIKYMASSYSYMSSSGGILYFKKINGKWEFIKNASNWVS